MNITPDAAAAKAETRLKGHLGHLTKEEQAAFVAFKELAAKGGYYIPATAASKASHDDGTMMYANNPPRSITHSCSNDCAAVTYELEDSCQQTLLLNSRTRKSGGSKTISRPCTRRSISMITGNHAVS